MQIESTMRLRARIWPVLLIILGSLWLPTTGRTQNLVRNYTPAIWQADPVPWLRDTDGSPNKIDDLIDAGPDTLYDVVVNYRRCVDDVDIAQLLAAAVPAVLQLKLKYLSSVAIGPVSKAQLAVIASWSEVAFIEGQWPFEDALDVSVANMKVAQSSTYSGSNIREEDPSINGSGVNIAILDTGVDDVTFGPKCGHEAFRHGPFVAGYQAQNQLFINPPDRTEGHGTFVASVALGRGTTNHPNDDLDSGVAPSAGLIDVDRGILWHETSGGLQVIMDSSDAWSVAVINMSFYQRGNGQQVNSDGTDAFCQLVDLAVAMGIVVVAAVGDHQDPNDPGIPAPGAATRAITVAASNDQGDVDRLSSTLRNSSNRGKRGDDGDHDVIDELKPEVTAPGSSIRAAWGCVGNSNNTSVRGGTSAAAPHVAGLAALLIQAEPTINAASVKNLIIRTAEDLSDGPSYEEDDPVWNDGWGWGLVDGYEAYVAATTALADLSFPNHPGDPTWRSDDIDVSPPAEVGQVSTITADIENLGPNPANQARIHFGVHVYSASTRTFYDIGTKIVDLPVGVTSVTMDWTPDDESHQCLEVEIGYGSDTDYDDNKAQLNVAVAESPVTFQVSNTHSEDAELIHFETSFENPAPGWQISITPNTITLAADDCPAEIEVLVTPPVGATASDTQIAHVAAVIGMDTLGGVTVIQVGCHVALTGDVNANGTLTAADIIVLVNYTFKGGPDPQPIPAAGDTNCSGEVTSADIIQMVVHVFKSGPAPCNVCTIL